MEYYLKTVLGLKWTKEVEAREMIQKSLPLCICSRLWVFFLFAWRFFKRLKQLLYTGAVVIRGMFPGELKGGRLVFLKIFCMVSSVLWFGLLILERSESR